MKRNSIHALVVSVLLCPIMALNASDDAASDSSLTRGGCKSAPSYLPCLKVGALSVGTINGEKFCCPSNGITSSSYFFIYDTTSQGYNPELATRSALDDLEGCDMFRQPPPPAAPTEFQNITFNTNANLKGWSHNVGTSAITCNQSGLYVIAYSANFAKPETRSVDRNWDEDLPSRQQPPGGGALGSIIVTVNEIEVAGSQGATPVQSDTFGDLSKVALFSAEKGDVLRLKFIMEADAPTEWGLVATEGQSSLGIEPSISVVVVRIA